MKVLEPLMYSGLPDLISSLQAAIVLIPASLENYALALSADQTAPAHLAVSLYIFHEDIEVL